MEITVISEEANPMLHRTDVRFRVSHAEATPDRLAVRDSLAARLNKDANEVVVRKLDTKYGMRETVGEAKVYQAAEFAEDVEQVHMLARNKIGGHGEPDEPAVEADEEPAVDADEEAEAAEEDAAEDEEPEAEEEATEDEEPEAEDAGADDESEEADEAADVTDEDDADEAEAETEDADDEDEE